MKSILGALLISFFLVVNLLQKQEILDPDPTPAGDILLQDQEIYFPVIVNLMEEGPQINAPHFSGDVNSAQSAIFWFGELNLTDNYTDIRVGYNNQELVVRLQVFDRRLWFDSTPAASDLTDWDAASLFLDLRGGVGSKPHSDAYLLVGQLNNNPQRETWQTGYRGNGSSWVSNGFAFTTLSGWRGNAPNDDQDDDGWSLVFRVPFTSLGLSGPPPTASKWGIAVALHDRDSAQGSLIPDSHWPADLASDRPETWNTLSFGLPVFQSPPVLPAGSATIRHRLNGASVTDVHVGGEMDCGQAFAPIYFNGWGDANHGGSTELNIQNQLDVADWPCFSKLYITFPLDAIPSGKVILSADLQLHLFGNSGEGASPPPQRSLVHVMTIQQSWQENSITWNNAPQPQENVSQSWVYPLDNFPGWPGIPYDWDLSAAVAAAYAAGKPLRIVLYSSDGAIHSGKYFVPSETGDWNQVARPTLFITWGN